MNVLFWFLVTIMPSTHAGFFGGCLCGEKTEIIQMTVVRVEPRKQVQAVAPTSVAHTHPIKKAVPLGPTHLTVPNQLRVPSTTASVTPTTDISTSHQQRPVRPSPPTPATSPQTALERFPDHLGDRFLTPRIPPPSPLTPVSPVTPPSDSSPSSPESPQSPLFSFPQALSMDEPATPLFDGGRIEYPPHIREEMKKKRYERATALVRTFTKKLPEIENLKLLINTRNIWIQLLCNKVLKEVPDSDQFPYTYRIKYTPTQGESKIIPFTLDNEQYRKLVKVAAGALNRTLTEQEIKSILKITNLNEYLQRDEFIYQLRYKINKYDQWTIDIHDERLQQFKTLMPSSLKFPLTKEYSEEIIRTISVKLRGSQDKPISRTLESEAERRKLIKETYD
ncbi:MAG: hypothetical protein ACHQVS_02640 [Candidatus Babeliales bacterium]